MDKDAAKPMTDKEALFLAAVLRSLPPDALRQTDWEYVISQTGNTTVDSARVSPQRESHFTFALPVLIQTI